MGTPESRMLEHFAEQAVFCEAYGSIFTSRLIQRMHADLAAGGPVASLVANWSGMPRADVVSLRLCGALHAAGLMGREPALAAEYPERRADWNIDTVWEIATAFLQRERAWVSDFITSPPQTNEVRRSIALLPGYLACASANPGPMEILELGASAGLNLHWDSYGYRTDSWQWGKHDGVVIDTAWSGPAPQLTAAPMVRARAGCDQNPLDLSDPLQRLRLRSYIWADQHERLARFDTAAAVAVRSGVQIERADAAAWVAQRLAARANDATTVVVHSVFLQYPNPSTRAAIVASIEAAGERATAAAPLAWLRLEPEAVLGGPRDSIQFLVDMITWPGAQRRVLAITDGHVRSVNALA